ncbi:hypothetical protein ACP70R_041267 [Stipagrostis hirtigluma subsp. patula]
MDRRPLRRPRCRPRRAFRPPVATPSGSVQRPPGSAKKAPAPMVDRDEAAVAPDTATAAATTSSAAPLLEAAAEGPCPCAATAAAAGHDGVAVALDLAAAADVEAMAEDEENAPSLAAKNGRASARKGSKFLRSSGCCSHVPATPRQRRSLASPVDRRRLQDQFEAAQPLI